MVVGQSARLGVQLDSELGRWRNFHPLSLSMSVLERDLEGGIAAEFELGAEGAPRLGTNSPARLRLTRWLGLQLVWALFLVCNPEFLFPLTLRSLPVPTTHRVCWGRSQSGHVRVQKCVSKWGLGESRALRVPLRETALTLMAVTSSPDRRIRHPPGFHVATSRDPWPLLAYPPRGTPRPVNLCRVGSPGRQRTPTLVLQLCASVRTVRRPIPPAG